MDTNTRGRASHNYNITSTTAVASDIDTRKIENIALTCFITECCRKTGITQ
jgi:hypothetical protein